MQDKITSNLRLIFLLARANIKSRYRGTVAGIFWVLANPLAQLFIQGLIFSSILKGDNETYLIYLGSGLIPWIFLQQSFDMVVPVLKYQGRILRNFQVAPWFLAAAQVIDNFLVFVIVYAISMIGIHIYLGVTPEAKAFLVIFPLFNIFLFTLAGSFLLSSLNVLYADIRFITSFFMTLFFFATPIFYTIEQLPNELQQYAWLNPMRLVIGQFQSTFMATSTSQWLVSQLSALGVTFFVLAFSVFTWKYVKDDVQRNLV